MRLQTSRFRGFAVFGRCVARQGRGLVWAHGRGTCPELLAHAVACPQTAHSRRTTQGAPIKNKNKRREVGRLVVLVFFLFLVFLFFFLEAPCF
jgi:hypothetical protein